MPDTKNAGPLLTSFISGDLNALPMEWRAKIGFTQEDQQMPLGYVPNGSAAISENLVQTRTDERKRTTTRINPPPPNGGVIPPGGGPPDSWMLVAEERLPWGQVATRTRAFVPEGSHLVLTDTMLQAEQRNLGIGLDQVVLTAPLPGPGIVDTKWDDTSSLVSTIKTRKLISTIVDAETIIGAVWKQVSHEGETATVASEIVKTQTLPGPSLISSHYDNDGTLVTVVRTKKAQTAITDGETIVGGVWTQKTHEDITGLVTIEVVTQRTVPGQPVTSYRLDDDGDVITVVRTKKSVASVIEGETAPNPTTWIRTFAEPLTQLLCTEVVETRDLGANAPIVKSSRYDADSTVIKYEKQKTKTSLIVESEDITGNVWTRTYKEEISGLVSWQVSEKRSPIPGPALTSYRLDDDGATVTIKRTKKALADVNEGETATAGLWTKTFAETISPLLSTEVVETRALGGNAPVVNSVRIDRDGLSVNVAEIKKLESVILPRESCSTTLWTKVYQKGISGLVAVEVTETATVPGPANISTKVDNDGRIITVTRTRKQAASIVTEDDITSGVWNKTYKEAEDGLLATEVKEARSIPGGGIPSAGVDQDKLTRSTTKTLKDQSTITPGAVLTGSTLIITEKNPVSDLVSEEIKTVYQLLDKNKFDVSIENPLPPQFRMLAKVTETTHVVAGAPALPTLSGTDIERSEERLDALTKKTIQRSLATGNFPVSFAGKELTTEYGGLLLSTEQKIDVAGSASIDIPTTDVTNKTVIRERLQRYGGYGIREKATAATGFPVLHGSEIDSETNFVIGYTQQVVDAGTAGASGSGTATEIKPLDAARSLQTIRTVNSSALSAFKLIFPGTTNVSIPPQLISLVGINAGQGGAVGSYSEVGSYQIVGVGNGSVDLHGSADSSAYSNMEVVVKIRQIWGQDIPCVHCLFFLATSNISYATVLAQLKIILNDTSIVAWPKFQPETVNFSIVDGRMKATATAKQMLTDTVVPDYLGRPTRGGSARTYGSGTGAETGVTVKTVTIPPTIHGTINISGTSQLSNNYLAAASVNAGAGTVTSIGVNSAAGSSVYPTSFAATGGQSTIPPSGSRFLHRMRVEPWKLGYCKVECEVVSSSDW